MSNDFIIASPKRVPLLPAEELVRAARERFGDALRVQPSPEGWEADCHLYVEPNGVYDFAIVHFADNLSVSFEGTPEQNAELAAWFRGLLPEDFPRVIAFDEGWFGHVDLSPGITADQVLSRWVDHSTPGWDANDPDLR